MIYVASPYSHPDPLVMEQRFNDVRKFTSVMISSGAVAFSSILYLHQIAIDYQLPRDAKFWATFNIEILRHCDMMIVCDMEGWQESKGVQMEISLAEHLGIPITHARMVY